MAASGFEHQSLWFQKTLSLHIAPCLRWNPFTFLNSACKEHYVLSSAQTLPHVFFQQPTEITISAFCSDLHNKHDLPPSTSPPSAFSFLVIHQPGHHPCHLSLFQSFPSLHPVQSQDLLTLRRSILNLIHLSASTASQTSSSCTWIGLFAFTPAPSPSSSQKVEWSL